MRWVETPIRPTKRNVERWCARFKLEVPVAPRTRQDFEARSLFGQEVQAWCREHFGKPHESHQTKYRWQMDGWTAHFRYPDDAFAFKIRWG